MIYLLDTNTCIHFLNGRSPSVYQRLTELPETDVCVCSIAKLELRFGALRSTQVEKTLAEQEKFLSSYKSLPFDDIAHTHAARIRAELARLGTPIGPYDLLIAAIAPANDLTLVTHNTREFSRVSGLRLEDWQAENT